MKQMLQTLNMVKKYWPAFLGSNLLMLLLGFLVISQSLDSWPMIKLAAALISAFLALIDCWVILSYVRLKISQFKILKNKRLTTAVGMIAGSFYNGTYVVIALLTGVVLQSAWYILYAFYHLLFALAKYVIGKDFRRNREDDDSWDNYGRVGYFLIVAALIFHLMVLFVAQQEDQIEAKYPFLVYIIALATFINAATSLSNLFRFRHTGSPLIKASKNISFASSLFSIFFLQTMMMKQFSSQDNPMKHQVMTIILGSMVFLTLVLMGIYMIVNAKRQVKQQD